MSGPYTRTREYGPNDVYTGDLVSRYAVSIWREGTRLVAAVHDRQTEQQTWCPHKHRSLNAARECGVAMIVEASQEA